MAGISREPRSCVLRQRQERSPLQKLLDYLLKGLEKRDPQQFFAWPVTDHIAPGYSQIIHQPMDFSTMKQKIDENQYSALNEYIVSSSITDIK
jgi:bromodomain-containing protein 7/9